LVSALVEGEWSSSRACCFTPKKKSLGARWIGSWTGPNVDLDDVEKNKNIANVGTEPKPSSPLLIYLTQIIIYISN
jgi:hypothetical protein